MKTYTARRGQAPTWAPLVLGFAVYVAFFVTGYFLNEPTLNVFGGLAMIYLAVIGNYRSMSHVARDAPTRWALLVVASFLVTFAAQPSAEAIGTTLKYALVFLLFIRIHSSGLPPLTSSRWRVVLFAICAVLIVFSAVFGTSFQLGGEERLSGIFLNPNNLALMGLGLLFFVNEKDRAHHQLLVHGTVLALLAVTNTLGAILAYAAGMMFRYRHQVFSLRTIAAVTVVVGAVALGGGNLVAARERLTRQIDVIEQNLDVALHGDVEYGGLVENYGDSATSGLWRIAMWSSVVRGYAAGSPAEWLFGKGLGSSPKAFGNHPHNEYLRLLAETGAIGLATFLGFFAVVIRALRPEDRHLPLMFLMYSFTENNLDNFVFMTLFVMFIGGAVRTEALRAAARRAAAGAAGYALWPDAARPLTRARAPAK